VIFVHKRQQVETVAATHEVVAKLDLIQLECGQGPDLELLTDRSSVMVSDTRLDTRWPNWARRVEEAGIRSMLGTRLYTNATTIGSGAIRRTATSS
jgi:hypothetical protein